MKEIAIQPWETRYDSDLHDNFQRPMRGEGKVIRVFRSGYTWTDQNKGREEVLRKAEVE